MFIRIGPDKRWPLSDRLLCAQEDGSSLADIGTGHDPQREEEI
jgi:hypothetical protein